MQEKKKFKAPNGHPDIRVALTSGHVTIIGQKFIDLPELFWQGAYAEGALSEDMVDPRSFDEAVAEKAAEVKEEADKFYKFLKEQLQTIYDKPNGNIDKNGNPLYRRVVSLVKKTVKKELIMKAWDEIKEEAEAKE